MRLQFGWPGCVFDAGPSIRTTRRIRHMGAAATGHVAGTAAPAFDRLRAVAVNPFDALDPASSNFYDDAGAIGEALIEIG
jgi:hypothetical protein